MICMPEEDLDAARGRREKRKRKMKITGKFNSAIIIRFHLFSFLLFPNCFNPIVLDNL